MDAMEWSVLVASVWFSNPMTLWEYGGHMEAIPRMDNVRYLPVIQDCHTTYTAVLNVVVHDGTPGPLVAQGILIRDSVMPCYVMLCYVSCGVFCHGY